MNRLDVYETQWEKYKWRSLGMNRACVCRQGLLYIFAQSISFFFSPLLSVSHSIHLFYMFCSCRQLFFTRCACVFKSQWFQLYCWWLFLILRRKKNGFISLSTLSCCESEPVIKIHLFSCLFFGNDECFIAIYNICVAFGRMHEKKMEFVLKFHFKWNRVICTFCRK